MSNGIILRRARDAKKMTLQQVSDAAKINKSTIHKIEVGVTRDPGFSVIVRLCRIYELSIDDYVKMIGL